MKWISVKEKMPTLGGEYLVVWELSDGYEPVVTCMEWDAIENRFHDIDNYQTVRTSEVLFWMPLPEPPQL